MDINDSINEADILIHHSSIGFISGKKVNPLNNIYFYHNKKPDVSFKINKKQVSYLIPNTFQEYLCMIFVKDRTNMSLINKMNIVAKQLTK